MVSNDNRGWEVINRRGEECLDVLGAKFNGENGGNAGGLREEGSWWDQVQKKRKSNRVKVQTRF